MSILGFVYIAIPFVISLGLGILIPYLVTLMYARFEAGLVAIFGMYALEALFMNVGGLNLGISIYYTDVVLILIGIVALLRLLFAHDFPIRHGGWLVFCSLVLLSFVMGLMSYGTGAGVQVRVYFYAVVAGLYGMSFPMDGQRLRMVFNALALLGLMLVGLSFYRWAVLFVPFPSLMPEGGTYNVDGIHRVIYSHSTLLVAQILLLGVFFAALAGVLGPVRFMSPLLLGVVLALQHRSVWLSVLVGIAASLLLGRKKQGTATQVIMLTAIVGITALPMAMSGAFSGVTQSIERSAERAIAGSDTTGERLESWQQIIKQWYGAGPRSILIGQSFGSNMTRTILDKQAGAYRKIDYAAHNMYVQTLFNTGIVGLVALLAAYGYTLRGLYRGCRKEGWTGMEAQALFVLLLMQVAYYVPYGVDYLQSLIFGVALSYVAGKSLEPESKAVPLNSWRSV